MLARARSKGQRLSPHAGFALGDATRLPLPDASVDVWCSAFMVRNVPDLDAALREAQRVLRPGGRLIVIGYYGRDDVAALLEPEVVDQAVDATHRRTGWWLRNGFKIKVVHARVDLTEPDLAHALLPRLFGDRGRAYLMGPHRSFLRLNLGLYHRAV
jgi:SAM-dependent methyltransferase